MTKPAHTNTSYLWEGKNRQGKRVKGEVRGLTPTAVKAELYRQGITPLKIRKQPTSLLSSKKTKIRSKDIALFTRQMATMMSAGVPIVQSLDIVARGLHNVSMRDLVFTLKTEVESGTSLSQALRHQPAYFDELYCNLVQAGEHAGVLENILNKIAVYKEKTESIKGKIKKALFYPVSVILVALIVTTLIMIYVVPQFQSMFRSAGADLPIITQWVIQLSQLISSYWGLAFGAGIVLSVLLLTRLSQQSASFRAQMDQWSLSIPVIGDILRKAALARFSRTTSTLFAAGIPLVDTLGSVAGATGNAVYSKAVLTMRDEVATGQSLHLAMQHHSIFPHMLMQMVIVGEESGALDDMLGKAADFYEEEVDNGVDSLSSLMEPFIMVVLGVLIGSIVIALYLPIIQLGSVLSGR